MIDLDKLDPRKPIDISSLLMAIPSGHSASTSFVVGGAYQNSASISGFVERIVLIPISGVHIVAIRCGGEPWKKGSGVMKYISVTPGMTSELVDEEDLNSYPFVKKAREMK
jgi:hypothetical protein